MSQIPKQERKLNDSKEQLRVIKVELETTNKELSETLRKKEVVWDEIRMGKTELNKISKDSKDKLKQLKIKEIELNNKELSLSMKEEDIKRNELTSVMLIEGEKKKLDKQYRGQDKKITKLIDMIDKKENKLSDITLAVDLAVTTKSELLKDIKNLSKDNTFKKKEFNMFREESEAVLTSITKDIKQKTIKLDELTNKLLGEQQKIGSAEKAIKLQNKQLDRKKKNLDVMITRFNKTFKKHYPITELKL